LPGTVFEPRPSWSARITGVDHRRAASNALICYTLFWFQPEIFPNKI
jgi:hypothetical protein